MNDMKLIMENWRSYTAPIKSNILINEAVQGKEYVNKIKSGLILLAAKKAGASFLKAAVSQIGPEIADATLDWIKTIPVAGNAVSSLSALWKTGKATVSTLMGAAEVGKSAYDVLKLAATDYVGIDDSQAKINPLAKLFNIDDRMETPISEEFLNNFAGLLLKHLQNNLETWIPHPEEFAEQALANYLRAKSYFGEAEPPANPA